MDILESARRHGFGEDDIFHALDNAISYGEQEYDGELRALVIGPARNGQLLEIVLVPVEGPTRVIHADVLRSSRHKYL